VVAISPGEGTAGAPRPTWMEGASSMPPVGIGTRGRRRGGVLTLDQIFDWVLSASPGKNVATAA